MSQTSLGARWRAVTGPLLVVRVFGQAAEFAGWVVLARRLGAASFGQVAVAFLVCRYAGLVADWGASLRGVIDVSAERDPASILALVRRRTLVTLALVTAYVAGTFVAGQSRLAPMAMVIACLGLSRDWLSLGRERGLRAGVPVAVQGSVILGAALVLPVVGHPAIPVALGYAVAGVLSIAVNRLPAGPRGRIVGLDAWLLLAILCTQVISTLDTILLAAMRSSSEAGIYAAIYRLPNGWLAVLIIVMYGLLPVITKALREDPESVRAIRRSLMRWSLPTSIGLLAVSPIAFFLVPHLFGPAFAAGRVTVVLLVAATAVQTAAAPLHCLYLAGGRHRNYAGFIGVAAALNTVANLALIPPFGMNGAAVATVVANTFLAALLWFAVARLAGPPPANPTADQHDAGGVAPEPDGSVSPRDAQYALPLVALDRQVGCQ